MSTQGQHIITPLEVLQELRQVLAELCTESTDRTIQALPSYKLLITQLQKYICKSSRKFMYEMKQEEVVDEESMNESITDTVFCIYRQLCSSASSLAEDILKYCLDHMLEHDSCTDISNLLLKLFNNCEEFRNCVYKPRVYSGIIEVFEKVVSVDLIRVKDSPTRYAKAESILERNSINKLGNKTELATVRPSSIQKLQPLRFFKQNGFLNMLLTPKEPAENSRYTIPKLNLGQTNEFSSTTKTNSRSTRRLNIQGKNSTNIKLKPFSQYGKFNGKESSDVAEEKAEAKKTGVRQRMRELAKDLGESYFVADLASLLALKRENKRASKLHKLFHKKPSDRVIEESRRASNRAGVLLNLVARGIDDIKDMKSIMNVVYLYCFSNQYHSLLKDEKFKRQELQRENKDCIVGITEETAIRIILQKYCFFNRPTKAKDTEDKRIVLKERSSIKIVSNSYLVSIQKQLKITIEQFCQYPNITYSELEIQLLILIEYVKASQTRAAAQEVLSILIMPILQLRKKILDFVASMTETTERILNKPATSREESYDDMITFRNLQGLTGTYLSLLTEIVKVASSKQSLKLLNEIFLGDKKWTDSTMWFLVKSFSAIEDMDLNDDGCKIETDHNSEESLKENALETISAGISGVCYLIYSLRLIRKLLGKYTETESYSIWLKTLEQMQGRLAQLFNPVDGILMKYIGLNGVAITNSSEPPLTHALTKAVLKLNEEFLIVESKYLKLFTNEWILFFIRTHYTNFIKVYIKLTKDSSQENELAKCYMRCLWAIAIDRTEETSKYFFNAKCAALLIEEIGLEHELAPGGDLYEEKSLENSAADMTRTNKHRGMQLSKFGAGNLVEQKSKMNLFKTNTEANLAFSATLIPKSEHIEESPVTNKIMIKNLFTSNYKQLQAHTMKKTFSEILKLPTINNKNSCFTIDKSITKPKNTNIDITEFGKTAPDLGLFTATSKAKLKTPKMKFAKNKVEPKMRSSDLNSKMKRLKNSSSQILIANCYLNSMSDKKKILPIMTSNSFYPAIQSICGSDIKALTATYGKSSSRKSKLLETMQKGKLPKKAPLNFLIVNSYARNSKLHEKFNKVNRKLILRNSKHKQTALMSCEYQRIKQATERKEKKDEYNLANMVESTHSLISQAEIVQLQADKESLQTKQNDAIDFNQDQEIDTEQKGNAKSPKNEDNKQEGLYENNPNEAKVDPTPIKTHIEIPDTTKDIPCEKQVKRRPVPKPILSERRMMEPKMSSSLVGHSGKVPKRPTIPKLSFQSLKKFTLEQGDDLKTDQMNNQSAKSLINIGKLAQTGSFRQKSIFEQDSGRDKKEIFLSYRNKKAIYIDEELHALMVGLLMSLLITPKTGILDDLYCSPRPFDENKINVLHLLHFHINHPMNSKMLSFLYPLVRDITPARAGQRLLKLLCKQFFDSTLYSGWRKIATGAYATVFECDTQLSVPELVAMKRLEFPKITYEQCILYDTFNEVTILERLRHQASVTTLYDYGVDDQNYYFIMKRYAISLKDWRCSMVGSMNEHLLLYLDIYLKVLKAVEVVHSHKVTHYDIKCDNFMLDKNKNEYDVTLGDFGVSKIFLRNEDESDLKPRGTECIKSPEMLRLSSSSKQKAQSQMATTRASDIWSLGCLLYELLAGKYLFSTDDYVPFYLHLTNDNEDVLTEENRAALSENVKLVSFMQTLLDRNPSKRPNISVVIIKFQQLMNSLTVAKINTIPLIKPSENMPIENCIETCVLIMKACIKSQSEANSETTPDIIRVLRNVYLCKNSDCLINNVNKFIRSYSITHIISETSIEEIKPYFDAYELTQKPLKESDKVAINIYRELAGIMDFCRKAILNQGVMLFVNSPENSIKIALIALVSSSLRTDQYDAWTLLSTQSFFMSLSKDDLIVLNQWVTLTSRISSYCSNYLRYSCLCGCCTFIPRMNVKKIYNCDCQSSTTIGCGQHLKHLKDRYGVSMKKLIWGVFDSTEDFIVGPATVGAVKDPDMKKVLLRSNDKAVPWSNFECNKLAKTGKWKVYKCSVCQICTHATKDDQIVLLLNFPLGNATHNHRESEWNAI